MGRGFCFFVVISARSSPVCELVEGFSSLSEALCHWSSGLFSPISPLFSRKSGLFSPISPLFSGKSGLFFQYLPCLLWSIWQSAERVSHKCARTLLVTITMLWFVKLTVCCSSFLTRAHARITSSFIVFAVTSVTYLCKVLMFSWLCVCGDEIWQKVAFKVFCISLCDSGLAVFCPFIHSSSTRDIRHRAELCDRCDSKKTKTL